MDDAAGVRLVDSHSERGRGDNDGVLASQEADVTIVPVAVVHPGVVVNNGSLSRVPSRKFALKEFGDVLRVFSRVGVNDRRLAGGVRVDDWHEGLEVNPVAATGGLRVDFDVEVRPIDGVDGNVGILENENVLDVSLDFVRAGSREGNDRDVPQLLPLTDALHLEEGRAEVVAPLGAAVDLVDSDAGEGAVVLVERNDVVQPGLELLGGDER